MKIKLTGEKIFDIILLAVVTYMVFTAFDFPFRARLMPLLVGVPAVVMMFVIVVRGLFFKTEGDSKPLTKEQAGRQKTMFLWLLILLGLILTLGLEVGLGIYLCFFVRLVAKQKWWLSIALGAGMALTVFLLFDVALNYHIFKGYLLGIFF